MEHPLRENEILLQTGGHSQPAAYLVLTEYKSAALPIELRSERIPTARFELATFALSTRRLCQLGYAGMGPVTGFPPAYSDLQDRRNCLPHQHLKLVHHPGAAPGSSDWKSDILAVGRMMQKIRDADRTCTCIGWVAANCLANSATASKNPVDGICTRTATFTG